MLTPTSPKSLLSGREREGHGGTKLYVGLGSIGKEGKGSGVGGTPASSACALQSFFVCVESAKSEAMSHMLRLCKKHSSAQQPVMCRSDSNQGPYADDAVLLQHPENLYSHT